MSGYLDDKIEGRLRALPFVREIYRKPFDLMRFADRLRRHAGLGAAGELGDGQAAGG